MAWAGCSPTFGVCACCMERAHVLVRLRGGSSTSSSAAGLCRTSATSVRLEHSEMSPGVASISFEQVFDVQDDNARVFESVSPAVDAAVDGHHATLVATGATGAGKSFACHGDQQKAQTRRAETGLITLAIRHAFRELETRRAGGWKFNVLLGCYGVGQSGERGAGALKDLVEGATCERTQDMEQLMLAHSVVVSTPAEAVHVYSKALGRVRSEERQAFVLALHVETLSPSGEARRGRLLVVDIQGGAIIEPRGMSAEGHMERIDQNQQKYFLDTQFPVHEPLSSSFGSFLGNSNVTYLLVAIQTPAQFQQQAIQSLLYACKAKEIKNSSAVNYISSFVERPRTLDLLKQKPTEVENHESNSQDLFVAPKTSGLASFPDPFATSLTSVSLSLLSPALSTTSSDSTCEMPFITSRSEELPEVSPSLSPSTSCKPDDLPKRSAVSMCVQKAYELAKGASSSPTKMGIPVSNSNQKDEATLHVVADALLRHLSWDSLRRMTLQAKLEQIRTTQFELERALAHETSIKDKCVDRISRLSQTMSCQVMEHEQQLQEALTAKHKAEEYLQETSSKFEDVGREVSRLQEQIKSVRSEHKIAVGNEDAESAAASNSVRSERTKLHTLSSRLEEAMSEAQDVVKFKDSVIQSLEERLQLASKRGADAVTLLEEERSRFEREKTSLLDQLKQSKKDNSSQTNEEVAKLQAESVLIHQQKAELTVKVAQLTLELETARSQWAHDIRNREERVEQRCTKQVSEAEHRHEEAAIAMQQQMAQFRTELDMKLARQRVAAQVACKASELQCERLERELQHMKLKLGKQKLKLDKKARVLVANAHKQHAKPVAALEHELEDLAVRLNSVLAREKDAAARAKKSNDSVERLQHQLDHMEVSSDELERERAALGRLCKELKTDKERLKTEHELRIHELEQSIAQRIEAAVAETRVDCERKVQALMTEHKNDLHRFEVARKRQIQQAAPERTRTSRQNSTSSISSRTSEPGDDGFLSSDSCRQQSIDELDALIDSKERRYKRSKQRRKVDSSSRSSSSSPPTKKSSSVFKTMLAHKEEQIVELTARQAHLLAALATANEQETLAKQQTQETEVRRQNELAQYDQLLQQLNCVKVENWNLSLALHVTETNNQQQQRHQQQHTPPRPSSFY